MRADALQRRNAIIEAATQLLKESGEDVALEKIAAHAGVGIATLYRNFPDKDSLLHACSAHLAEKFLAVQDRTISRMNGDNAPQCVREYATSLFDLDLNILIPALAPHKLEDLPAELLETRDKLLNNGQTFIRLGQKFGQIGPGVSHWQFIVGLLSLTRPRKINVDAHEPNLNSRMVRLYLAGIKTGHPTAPDTKKAAPEIG